MKKAVRRMALGAAVVAAAVFVGLAGVAGAALFTETFDSQASAAAHGWVAVDGDGPSNSDGGADLQAGWSVTELASSELPGDQSGEGRVRGSRGANTNMTYYADTDLGRTFSFADRFSASGRMDFGALSGNDYIGTGFTLGFFDRNATLTGSNFRNANYLVVGFYLNQEPNALVYMGVQRSDASGNLPVSLFTGTTLVVSVANDLLFAFNYDPTAGANGQGLPSGTITDASTLGVTSFSIDLTAANRTALAGGVLNSFGLVKPRAANPQAGYADWHFDDVTYSVPEPASLTLLATAGLLALRRRR